MSNLNLEINDLKKDNEIFKTKFLKMTGAPTVEDIILVKNRLDSTENSISTVNRQILSL